MDQQTPPPGPIRALIFDFDGLILDTEVPIFQSWLELYQANGAHLTLLDWINVVGTVSNELDHFDGVEAQIGRCLDDKEALGRYRRQREWELLQNQPILPGVEQYLQDARRLGIKTGLASSSPRSWVTGHLTRLGLIAYFDTLRTRDDVREVKPDPELYLTVLADLQLAAHEVLVFEDSPTGVTAARRAGLFVVAVPNPVTAAMSLEHARLRLKSLADLSLEELIRKVTHRNGRT